MADIRFAFRHFVRKPLTTVTIVLVLALGIGVNTGLFSVIQAFTMRPAPGVPHDKSHVRIWGEEQSARGGKWQLRDLTYSEFQALASRKETFTAVAGWTADEVILQPGQGHVARAVRAEFVTHEFWNTLGVRLVAGPGFTAPEPNVPDFAAVITFALAEELFANPADAVGHSILINELPVRIAGVAPPSFEGALADNGRAQLWLPISARSDLIRATSSWLNNSLFAVFARLAPGITFEQATAIARDITVRALPDSTARNGGARSAEVKSLRAPPPLNYNDEIVGFAALGVVALLILIVACTNVSSLLVASAVGRRHEIAVRLSLGASRARVLRQLLTESALLAVVGGVAGLLLCWWITTLVAKKVNVDIVPDGATLVFTMTFAIGTGILFGLSPALHATRAGVATALRDSGSGATRSSRLQRIFVVAQIVFSQPLLLLIAVVLSVALRHGLPTPDPVMDRVVSAFFRPLYNTGAPSQRQEALDSLAPQLAALPGVQGVLPQPSGFAIARVPIPHRDGEGSGGREPIAVRVEGSPPGYFALIDIPIILGRDVSLLDTANTEYSVVIGSDLAKTLWGAENPIGKTLAPRGWRTDADAAEMVVIGVYDATRTTTRGMGIRVYTAKGKHWRKNTLLIRTTGPARALVPQLHAFIRAEAPTLPLVRLETMTEVINHDRRDALTGAAAAGMSAAVALTLASIGLFAVVALAVGQRRREIGIRIALGAEPLRVARMFFSSGLRMCVFGLLIGLPISIVVLHVALSRGVVLAPTFNLPLVGTGIAVVMLAVASAATWFPARRAATVDPATALRAE